MSWRNMVVYEMPYCMLMGDECHWCRSSLRNMDVCGLPDCLLMCDLCPCRGEEKFLKYGWIWGARVRVDKSRISWDEARMRLRNTDVCGMSSCR